MTRLRSCYFCGTTGALSEYATLPSDLRADGRQPSRVVLCDRCHTKLTNVLAPVVERLRTGDGQDPPGSATASDDGAEGESAAVSPEPAPASAPTEQPEVTFSEPTVRGDDAAGTESPSDSDPEPASAEDGTDGAEDGTNGAEAGTRDDEADGTDSDEGEQPSTTAADAPESSDGAGEQATVSSGSPDDADTAPDRLDRVYHQLLRFLRNREFPLPRAEAEAVAQSAYDLSASEATEVIQRTIDRDVLEERGDELHRR